jgi:hypothetical protein
VPCANYKSEYQYIEDKIWEVAAGEFGAVAGEKLKIKSRKPYGKRIVKRFLPIEFLIKNA